MSNLIQRYLTSIGGTNTGPGPDLLGEKYAYVDQRYLALINLEVLKLMFNAKQTKITHTSCLATSG